MDCCSNKKTENKKGEGKRGLLSGLIYGLLPHIGCIGFIVFTVLGVTAATAVFRPLLLNPYFFHILIALAIFFATVAAAIYLQKNGLWSWSGIKRKKGYLFILYGTTISVNLLLFMVIFPIAANISAGSGLRDALTGSFAGSEKVELCESGSLLILQVDIPCPGHAPLITGEIRKISGVENVKFRFPNFFDVRYDIEKTFPEQITALEIFDIYKASMIKFGPIKIDCSDDCSGLAEGCGCGCSREG